MTQNPHPKVRSTNVYLTSQIAVISKTIDQIGVNYSQNLLVLNHLIKLWNNNLYSNYYNPGWKNHSNFSWYNYNISINPSGNLNNHGNLNYWPYYPPGFNPNPNPRVKEKKLTMEEVMLNMGNQIQNQGATIRNIENQLVHIATTLTNRPSGNLSSTVEVNPKDQHKEQIKVIQLRSGKEVEIRIQRETEVDEEKKEIESDHNENEQTQIPLQKPLPLFPQWLKQKNKDKQFTEVLKILKKLTINIPKPYVI